MKSPLFPSIAISNLNERRLEGLPRATGACPPKRTCPGPGNALGAILAATLALANPTASASITALEMSVQEEPTGASGFASKSELIIGPILNDAIPVVTGRAHTVTLWGDLVNLCDRVELFYPNYPATLMTLRGGAIQRAHESTTSRTAISGKGRIRFNIPAGMVFGMPFQVRVRYAAEVAGFDSLKCLPIRRLVIDSADWVGATQPAVQAAGGRETSTLTVGTAYQLRLHTSQAQGFESASRVQLGYGWPGSRQVFGFPVNALQVSPPSSSLLTITFTPDRALTLDNATRQLRLTDAAPADRGWGEYIFHRFRQPLPTTGPSTDLARIIATAPAGAAPPPPAGPCPGGLRVEQKQTPEPTPDMLATAPTLLAPAPGSTGVGVRTANGVDGVILEWTSYDDFQSPGFEQLFPIADHYELSVVPLTPPPGFSCLVNPDDYWDRNACSTVWTGTPEVNQPWFLCLAAEVLDDVRATVQFRLPLLRPGTTYAWSVRGVNDPGPGCVVSLDTPCRTVVLTNPLPAAIQSPFATGTFTTLP